MANEMIDMEKKEAIGIIFGKKSPLEMLTESDLRHMGRKDLVEILLEMKIREEKLIEELAAKEQELNERQIKVQEAGSIANAALSLNNIFDVAQKAADDYLFSIHEQYKDSELVVQRAKDESERILAEANSNAEKKIKDTEIACEAKVYTANAQCEEKINSTNAACDAKVKETEQLISSKWDDFQSNVQKVLSAHAELTGLLSTPRPTQPSESVSKAPAEEA